MKANKATKVIKVESYKDSQEEHQVVKGKLVLIKCTGEPNGNVYLNSIGYKSIIISETEEIEVGDLVLDCVFNNLVNNPTFSHWDITRFRKEMKGTVSKILVLPEQFSPKHLQAIIDGKLKDGDEVYVECEEFIPNNGVNLNDGYYQGIKLFYPNPIHIKLFPVKKEESWNDIFNRLKIKFNIDESLDNEQIHWFKDNYNPPTKK